MTPPSNVRALVFTKASLNTFGGRSNEKNHQLPVLLLHAYFRQGLYSEAIADLLTRDFWLNQTVLIFRVWHFSTNAIPV